MEILLKLVYAFLFGLVSSIHCVSMCFCIMANAGQMFAGFKNALLINLCRITSYSILGAVFSYGSYKVFFFTADKIFLYDYLRVVSSFILILSAVHIAGIIKISVNFPLFVIFKKVSHIISNFIKNYRTNNSSVNGLHIYRQAAAYGLLWGLMPCAMVYTMLLYASFAGSFVYGGLVMFAFGLGTLPALILAYFVSDKIMRNIANSKLTKIILLIFIIILAFGILLIDASKTSFICNNAPLQPV